MMKNLSHSKQQGALNSVLNPSKFFKSVFCLFLFGLFAFGANAQIKVMSYNIHYGTGMDGKNSMEAIAELIKEQDPDIVGLQEIGDSIMAQRFGEMTGMHVVFGPSLDGRMNGYGDAVLSKYPFEYEGNYSIPSASSSRYQAMAVKVDFSAKSKDLGMVRLINTHFDWLETIGSENARLATIDVIEEAFMKEDRNYPTILTGDLNSRPNSNVLTKLKKLGWVNSSGNKEHFTIGSDNPTMQIDYVLFRPARKLKVTNFYVIDGVLSSDHLPVVAELMFK